MESKIVREMEKRLVKSFLDLVVVFELRKSSCLSGYDVIEHINKKFGLLVSPGTVYALLYSMERKGLIKANYEEGKRVYTITDKGTDFINSIVCSEAEIQRFFKLFLHDNSMLQSQ